MLIINSVKMKGSSFIITYSILSYFVFCCFFSNAATIKGMIKNEKNMPIANQKVFLGKDIFFVTDQKGYFIFNNVGKGNHDLLVKINEEEIILKTILIDNENEEIILGDIFLLKNNFQLKEVEISETYTSRHFDRMTEIKGNVIYSGKKNEVLLLDHIDGNKAQNNPRQILGRIPGMNFSETEGSGFPSNGFGLRGLNPTQSIEMNTRQNGYNITADIFGYNESYYNPALEAVDRIEIIRGASSLQFGPQFGGVVNFIMKQTPKNKVLEFSTMQTIGSFGLVNTFNSIGGSYKKWNYYAYAQYKTQIGWRPNSTNSSVTGFAKIEYQANEKLKAGLEYSILRNQIQMPGGLTDDQFENDSKQSTRQRNWLNSPWNILNASIEYKFSDQTSLNIKSTFLFSERNLVWKNEDGGPGIADSISALTNQFVQREVQREKFSSTTTEARMITNYKFLGMNNSLALGVRYFYGKMKRQGGGLGSTGTDFDLTNYAAEFQYALDFTTINFAPFIEHIFRVNNKFSITPGFRYEYIQSTLDGFVTDSLKLFTKESRIRNIPLFGIGMEYKISVTTNIYANCSQAYRPMDYSSLTPMGVSSKIDPNIKDASGYNADFGWRGTIDKFLNFDVGGFLLAYNNRIGLLDRTDSKTGNIYTFRTNTGNSLSTGIETYIELNPMKIFKQNSKIGYVNIFNSFAYVDAKYTSGTDESGNSLKGNNVEYAPNKINRLGITYGIKGVSVTFQISNTSKSYSDANNTEKSSDAIIGVIPAYQVMDLSATYKIRNIIFKGGINNLSDSRYFTKRTDEYPGPGIIPSNGRSFHIGVGAKF